MPDSNQVELDAEYRLLREAAGLLGRERSHLVVSGPDAAEYLQGQVTNDVLALEPGSGCYAALLDHKGHMRADMRVLCTGEAIRLDSEPESRDALLSHLRKYSIGRQVEVAEVGDETALLSLIGPGAAAICGAAPLPELGHAPLTLAGTTALAVGTDLGVDLIVAAADVTQLSEALLAAGAEPVSEAAAEILRVESGRPRFGREMSEATIPQEAGINERAVSFTKGCYIGQETVARLHYKGKPNRHLRGLRLSAAAAEGSVLMLGEREVGTITSACLSPALGPIALAMVRREAEPGDLLVVGEGEVQATVSELPFA